MTIKIKGYSCPACSFALWLPICDLKVSVLGLYNDSRYPGRCILVLKQHETDLTVLSSDLAFSFLSDAQMAARTIKNVTGSPRLNFAILGNQEPHLHFHLIPRGGIGDVNPRRTPWESPLPKADLSQDIVQKLIEEICAGIGDQSSRRLRNVH